MKNEKAKMISERYKEICDTGVPELNDLLGGGIITPGVNLFMVDDNDIDLYVFVYSFIHDLCKNIQSGHDIYTIFMDKIQSTGNHDIGIYLAEKSGLFNSIADISYEYKRASFIITNKSTFCTRASYISSVVFDVKKVDNGYKFILWKSKESEADFFYETKYCILSRNDKNKIICVESH